MGIEKLIKKLQSAAKLEAYYNSEYNGLYNQAATALSALQAENEKLRAESIMHHNAADNYWHELNEYRQERNEALAELEQVKRERDAAVEQLHGICSACKNYSPYHNKGKCRFCVYEPAREKDVEANDNWQWRGIKED